MNPEYEEKLQNGLKELLEIGSLDEFEKALDGLYVLGVAKGGDVKLRHIVDDREPGTSQMGCGGGVEFPQYDGPPTYSEKTRGLALAVLSHKMAIVFGDLSGISEALSPEESDMMKEASKMFGVVADRLEKVMAASEEEETDDSEPHDSNCPKCKKPGHCFHDGDKNQGELHYDRYRFICGNPECGHRETQDIYGGSSHGDNWRTGCPFCHQTYEPKM